MSQLPRPWWAGQPTDEDEEKAVKARAESEFEPQNRFQAEGLQGRSKVYADKVVVEGGGPPYVPQGTATTAAELTSTLCHTIAASGVGYDAANEAVAGVQEWLGEFQAPEESPADEPARASKKKSSAAV